MESTEVTSKLTGIFRSVFGDNSTLVLTNELTANDVEK